jgi:hypothetical protein
MALRVARGLFRLWLVVSVLWIAGVGVVTWRTFPVIPEWATSPSICDLPVTNDQKILTVPGLHGSRSSWLWMRTNARLFSRPSSWRSYRQPSCWRSDRPCSGRSGAFGEAFANPSAESERRFMQPAGGFNMKAATAALLVVVSMTAQAAEPAMLALACEGTTTDVTQTDGKPKTDAKPEPIFQLHSTDGRGLTRALARSDEMIGAPRATISSEQRAA